MRSLGGRLVLVALGALAPLLAIIAIDTAKTRAETSRIRAGHVSQSGATIAEVDPHVAVTTRGSVAIAWMGVTNVPGEGTAARTIGVRVSTDLGASFGAIDEARAASGRFSTDSMLAALPDDTFALTWLGFRANLARGGEPYDLAVYMSRIGTPHEWPIEVTAGVRGARRWIRFDKPWTAVSKGGATVTSYRFEAPDGAGIQVSRSKDGVHFEHAIVDQDRAFGGTLATICTDQDWLVGSARVVVAYPDARGRTWAKITARWSDDGGATFPRENSWIVTPNDAHAVVEAPYCAIMGGRIVVAYGVSDAPPNDAANALLDAVVIARTDDGGGTFASATFMEPGAKIFHPAFALSHSGDFEIVYASGKSDGDANGSVRRVRLSPEGEARGPSDTLVAPVRIVTRRDPEKGWTGDFQGIAMHGTHALVAAGDNEGGLPHVRFLSVE